MVCTMPMPVNHKGTPCIHTDKFCQEGYCSECELSKKKILLDIDGVICAYDFESLVWNKFKAKIDSKNIFAYNLADVLGVPSSEIDEMFHSQVWGMPFFNPEAIETLKLWKEKHQVLIYSNRIKYMGIMGLATWLIDYRIPFTAIDDGKGQYDFHIDDRPEKLCSTDSKVKLLYHQEWNARCLNVKNNLQRVYNWGEIKNIVENGNAFSK